MINDRENQELIYNMICLNPDMDRTLDWPVKSLLFERRIKQADKGPASLHSLELYNAAASPTSQTSLSIANSEELREVLKDYESHSSVPEVNDSI
ncbi:hypothetical protein FS749_010206 [Ceratobasidium sp. UAMH 11750]|nr:hypothetical protein FS749_010206 [Ceratobasidium sp. UAMH 11750]